MDSLTTATPLQKTTCSKLARTSYEDSVYEAIQYHPKLALTFPQKQLNKECPKSWKHSKESPLNKKTEKTTEDIRKSGYRIGIAVCLGLLLTVVVLGVVVGIMVTRKQDDNTEDPSNLVKPPPAIPPAIPPIPHGMDPKMMVMLWLPKFEWDTYAMLTIDPLQYFLEIRNKYLRKPSKYSVTLKSNSDIAIANIKSMLTSMQKLGDQLGHHYGAEHRTEFETSFDKLIACLVKNFKKPDHRVTRSSGRSKSRIEEQIQTLSPSCTSELSKVVQQMSKYVTVTDQAFRNVTICAEKLKILSDDTLAYDELSPSGVLLREYITGFTKFSESLKSATEQLEKQLKNQFNSIFQEQVDFRCLAYIEIAESFLAHLFESYPTEDVRQLLLSSKIKPDKIKAKIRNIYKQLMMNYDDKIKGSHINDIMKRMMNE